RHWATRHWRPNPSATVKSSSGVILLIESTHSKCKSTPLFCSPNKYQQLLHLRDRSEEREKGYRTQKAVTFPARSEACSSEKRNKSWRGPTKWGGGRLCRIRPRTGVA